jgi:integrase
LGDQSALGGKKLSALEPEDIKRFDANCVKLGSSSREKLRRVFSTALRDAVRNRHIDVNPMALVRFPKRRDVPEIGVWTPEEAKAFLRVARGSEHFALFLTAIVGALGPAELFGIKWRYVDLKRGTVSIVGNLTETGGRLIYKDVKVASRRRLVQLPKLALSELQALHARKRPKPDDYVFTAPEGGGIRRTTFRNRVWLPLLKRAKVPLISPYGLRHSSASLLAALGVPLMVASRALGHSNIRTTANVYVHLFPEARRDVADRLDEFLRDV